MSGSEDEGSIHDEATPMAHGVHDSVKHSSKTVALGIPGHYNETIARMSFLTALLIRTLRGLRVIKFKVTARRQIISVTPSFTLASNHLSRRCIYQRPPASRYLFLLAPRRQPRWVPGRPEGDDVQLCCVVF